MAQIADTRPVGRLEPHPENAAIYADGADAELVQSVRAHGVLTPLLVTPAGQIISGHRRWDAAKRAGLPQVPVVVVPEGDPLALLGMLLEANRQREKTGEQLGREYEASKRVEAELARRRMLAGTKPDPEAISPQGRAPQAGDLAAERIGVGRQKAERAAAVNRTVERLERAGESREAQALRRTLNTKSVNRAWTQARARGYLAPPATPAPAESVPAGRRITLEEWRGLPAAERVRALARPAKSGARLNEQKSTDIEWAQWSWNPVTGCLHDCSYCYARDIANGGASGRNPFPQGFAPTFLPDRLGAPERTPVPARAADEPGYGNVFTCSMADLFGRWVPREWIEAVLAEVRANPQWNFLFLTKFPVRLQEFNPFPANAWVGTTVDAQARVANAEKSFARVEAKVKWLSCEPLLEPLRFSRLDLFDWVVIGGASASTQTPEWRPPWAWHQDLYRQAKAAGCEVYMKSNLLARLREYPGRPEAPRVSVPDAFKMGYLQRDVLEPAAYARELPVTRPAAEALETTAGPRGEP